MDIDFGTDGMTMQLPLAGLHNMIINNNMHVSVGYIKEITPFFYSSDRMVEHRLCVFHVYHTSRPKVDL